MGKNWIPSGGNEPHELHGQQFHRQLGLEEGMLPSDVVMFSSKTSKCATWQDPWPKALPKARLWSCKHLHYVYAECVYIYMFMQLYTYK